MDTIIAPKENIEIYCLLYAIETALRELIIKSLTEVDGQRWYKKRLPGDILDKYRKGVEFEKSIPWSQMIPHHPIYYIDFPDLKKIFEREDNWKDVFKHIFGSRKDILSSTISELELIRNKIAHNRKTTNSDVEIVKGAYAKLTETIGIDRFSKLAAGCTCILNITDQLRELQKEGETSFRLCNKYSTIGELVVWKTIFDKWWFDDSYLGSNIVAIIKYFSFLEEYAKLPRFRGSGHSIELWVKSNNICHKFIEAKDEFSHLLTIGGKQIGFK